MAGGLESYPWACLSRMSITSGGAYDTSQAQVPKPPCWFTARTHWSSDCRFAWFCCVSWPFTSRTSVPPLAGPALALAGHGEEHLARVEAAAVVVGV